MTLDALLRAHGFMNVQRPPEIWEADTEDVRFVPLLGEMIAASLSRGAELAALTLNVSNVVIERSDDDEPGTRSGPEPGEYVAVTVSGAVDLGPDDRWWPPELERIRIAWRAGRTAGDGWSPFRVHPPHPASRQHHRVSFTCERATLITRIEETVTAGRVAALYDIHGNLPALEAVLRDVRLAGVDMVVVGGDILPGPMPVESLARLSAPGLATQFIHGNGDRVVLAQMRGQPIDEVPERYREVIRWTTERLAAEHEALLAGWPSTCRVDVRGLGEVLFCHATPRNDVECFTRLTPEDRLAPVFAGVDVPVVVCGHTHMQFDRAVGRVRVVNAGSVGMPFCGPRGAHWLLLGPDVELRCTRYDFDGAAESIRRTGFPMVEELAVRYVLQPPAEAETLQMFAPAELK